MKARTLGTLMQGRVSNNCLQKFERDLTIVKKIKSLRCIGHFEIFLLNEENLPFHSMHFRLKKRNFYTSSK